MSSRTVRHFFPSAFRVNVTPVALLPLLPLSPLSLPTASSELPVPPVELDELPAAIALRTVEGEMEPPVDGPAAAGAGPADVVPVSGPAAVPPAGAGGCGVVAVCGAGTELVTVTFDVGLTVVEPAVVGGVVLFVSDCTTLGPFDELGALGVLAAWSIASEGFEPPLPLGGTVVVGAGCTVVLVVAGAVVVGGVAGATVVTGALLAAVP